jgi:Asp-tRNA(Asn)/Glu-tRNA(Gln) amidotransferase A subunit family amidase
VPEFDFRTTTVADLAAAVRRREVAARELVAHALERIDSLNPSVNAFTAVDGERALAEATTLDERIAAGDDVGPLAGIPIGVKDTDDATGFVTAFGSAAHAGDAPATRDSVQVERLRAAGCVVLGKTNMPEFGLRGETDNRTFGITRNPWNLAYTPGGSSGGSAAAVAAGMVPLATGSDGGGSIRIPSAACGLTGLKPTLGRVPAADPSAPGWAMLSTRGPIARRAGDVALALDSVVGPHPHDIRSLPAKSEAWGSGLAGAPLPRRIGWSPTLGYADVDAEVLDVCRALVERCADAGAEIVEVDRVFSTDPGVALGTLVQNYIRRTVEPLRGTEWWTRLDPLVIAAAELGGIVARDPATLVRAEDACHERNIELVEAMQGVDVLLCPTTRAVTPECERPTTVEELLLELGGAGLVDATSELGIGLDDVERIIESVRSAGPMNLPAGRCNGTLVAQWHGMTQAFNMTRTPAGTICAGLTHDGLPIGIQVIGRQHDDLGVLRTLAALEEVSGMLDHLPVRTAVH